MPNAIRFNRTGTTGSVSRTTNLPSITLFSMLGWFNALSLASSDNFMAFGASAAAGAFYGVQINSTGNKFSIWNSAANTDGTAVFNANQWYHVALTVAGTGAGQALCYVNGVLDITASGSAGPSAQKMFYGNDNSSERFDGYGTGFKVYNRVLSAAEVAAEMYAGVLPLNWVGINTVTSPLSPWEALPLSYLAPDKGGVTTRWPDFSGNGYNWTETGTLDTVPGPPIKLAPRASLRPIGAVNGGGGGVTGKMPIALFRRAA